MLAALMIVSRLIEYEAVLLKHARREIQRWATAAAMIPDPTLRHLATEAVALDASNAEAAAAFASMAPRRLRRAAVELLVVHQLLLDYVDILGEHIVPAELEAGIALGQALPAALARPGSPVDVDPLGDDGGYLTALIACARSRLWRCPSTAVVWMYADAAAERVAHGLAQTHTAARSSMVEALRHWSAMQEGVAGYTWWEMAAGSNSNLALLALLAAATDPRTTSQDAARIASAYWPHVCVLSTLLDSLVDYERDATGENFSFVSRYPDDAAATAGLVQATQRSLAAVKSLPHRHTHTMIVCGVVAYYASAAAPRSLAAEIAPSVVAQLGRAATPIILALRARHRRCCCARPVRSRVAAFLARARGSAEGPGGSAGSTTSRGRTDDLD